MTMANVDNVRDLLAMEIQGHEKLKCSAKDDKGKTSTKLLPEHNVGTLKSFERFTAHQHHIGVPISDQHWQSIDCDDFDQFRISPCNVNNPLKVTSPNPSSNVNQLPQTMDKV